MNDLSAHATLLRTLHVPGAPLVLPNAWDAHSARRVVAAGFPVGATSSAAVAEVAGWDDGESMPVDAMFASISEIAAAVDVPVTADIESGYGLASDDLAQRLLTSGAVGCNLEDSDHRGDQVLVPAEEHASRISALLEAGLAAGVDLVINARIDVHLRSFGAEAGRLDEIIGRCNRYLEAGATCAYPIGVDDPAMIAAIVDQVAGPVNILLRRGTPTVAELARLGVARVSVGSGLFRIAMKGVDHSLASLAAGDVDLWA